MVSCFGTEKDAKSRKVLLSCARKEEKTKETQENATESAISGRSARGNEDEETHLEPAFLIDLSDSNEVSAQTEV